MDKLSTWLFWFNIGLVFISVFLGWLTTRIGLNRYGNDQSGFLHDRTQPGSAS
jgi:hypothetical protein